jgi:hypothetical protein
VNPARVIAIFSIGLSVGFDLARMREGNRRRRTPVAFPVK